MKKEGLLYGAVILLISNLIIKLLGFFYRVFLVRILGTEGIGLMEMVIPLYTFTLVMATWGIPLAMSKMIAEEVAVGNYKNVRKIFKITLILLLTSGTICTTLVYIFTPFIMKYFVADQRVYFCFITMIPAIFIIAICSVFRAYFQGIQQVSAIGISQTIEQSIRVIVGLTLAINLKKYGLEIAIIAISVATVLGEFSGLIFMIFKYRNSKMPNGNSSTTKTSMHILKKMFTFGTPVTITRVLATLLMALQAFLIPKSLIMAGYDLRTSTQIYGQFSGVALTLLHLPGMLTMSMAVSIIPAVAEAMGKGDIKLLTHRISEALQITIVFSIPSMIILYFYPRELCEGIFNAAGAGESLKILALGGVFLFLQQTLTGILQGIGHVKALLINLICSGTCLIGGIMFLTPIPNLGINGAAISLTISFIVGSMLNFYYIISRVNLNFSYINIIVKPVCAGIISLLILYQLDYYLRIILENLYVAIFFSILSMISLYFLILLLLGGLKLNTFKRIPIINKWI